MLLHGTRTHQQKCGEIGVKSCRNLLRRTRQTSPTNNAAYSVYSPRTHVLRRAPESRATAIYSRNRTRRLIVRVIGYSPLTLVLRRAAYTSRAVLRKKCRDLLSIRRLPHLAPGIAPLQQRISYFSSSALKVSGGIARGLSSRATSTDRGVSKHLEEFLFHKSLESYLHEKVVCIKNIF